jgi:tetratricopeptide (TPR) repeat protein/transcriptional regulator with XRE-family HTH domain
LAIATRSSVFGSFGSLLKAFRKSKHITQEQLAAAVGVHRNAIGRWEQGDVLPASRGMILEIARYLRLGDQETRQLLEASLTALAPHWSVPLPRNPFFTGREEILEALHTQLSGNQTVAFTQSSALHGLGGVGKTQIALEYAYRHALEYNAVFWLGAETEEQIVSSVLRIADILQLPGRDDKDQQHVIMAVQHWLTMNNQWLLIWDNVEDLALLDRFLPPTRQGAILITTRSQALGTFARGVDLLPMEQEEGTLFLLRRAKVLESEATNGHLQQLSMSKPGEYAAAMELATVLGGLPLALDQAGAYIEETGCSLSGYLQRYEQQCTHLLDRRGNLARNHPHSVTMTFRLSMVRVEREHPAAADLLRVCALLHAEAIPEELFVEGATHLGPELALVAADPSRFDQAIVVLRDLSLLQRQSEMRTLSLHRLVQAVLRESLEATAAQQWSGRVLQAINTAFPEPDFINWARCERCVPHAQRGLQLVEQAGRSMLEARELFSKAGSYLLERGRYAEAERFLVQACTLGEQQHKGNDMETASMLDRLATLYWRQEKYQQAEPLFQRALAISEQCLGPTHIDTAKYLNNLALLYYGQGNYKQAERLQHRSLTIVEHQLEPLHSHLAQNFDNMARIVQAQGKYTQAEQLYQHALTIWESQSGPPQPSMTFSLNNLGNLYLEQGKYELAEPLFQRALAIRQQSLGPDHPRTATSLNNLARLFLKQGKYEEAVQLSQRALLILEQQVEAERSYLALTLENLGALYLVQRKYEQAEPLLMRALTIQEQHRGQHHPETAQTLHVLALLRQEQDNLSEAISFAERALKIRSQALGDAHPKTVATHALYAQLVREQAGAQEEAASKPRREEMPDSRREGHHTEKAISLLHETGNPSSSENDSLQRFLNACCELHPCAWCRISDLWHAYEQWAGEHQERFPLSRRAFATQVKARGCRTDRTNTARIWRGITLMKPKP